MPDQLRRIVTGHDEAGKAIIVSDGPPGRVFDGFAGVPGLVFYEFWTTSGSPVGIDRRSDDPVTGDIQLSPPPGGVRIRMLDFPPEETRHELTEDERRAHFASIGAGEALDADAPHPFMHRTETVDYGIVLEGEIVLIVDKGETLCRKGDVIVQRGTNHAWANRSGKPCRMAFILIDGKFADGLER
jgi:Cupin domain